MYFNIDRDLLSGRKGIFTAEEIYSQPKIWKDTINNIYHNQDEIRSFTNKFLAIKKKRIILTGTKSLAFACEVCAKQLSSILGFTVESISSTDIVLSPKDYLYEDTTTLLISLSRSGNAQENVVATDLAKLIIKDLYQLVITCNRSGEIAISTKKNERNLVLLMPQEANDRGFIATGSFTSMMLSCLAVFFINDIESFKNDTVKLCDLVKKFIKNNAEKISELSKVNCDKAIYLGTSTSKFIAKDSAYKLISITQGIINTNYCTSIGLRSGYDIVLDNKTLTIIYLSDNKYTRKYDLDLARDLVNNKLINKLVIVTSNKDIEGLDVADYIFELGKIEYDLEYDIFLPIQQVVFGQMLSYMVAFNLGIEPDDPFSNGCMKDNFEKLNIYEF
ncbi:MAG: SIS domain-containing protein [Peptostreptococcaceae bacterium]